MARSPARSPRAAASRARVCRWRSSVALRGRTEGLAAELGGKFAPALRASSGGSDKGHVLLPDYEAAFRLRPEYS